MQLSHKRNDGWHLFCYCCQEKNVNSWRLCLFNVFAIGVLTSFEKKSWDDQLISLFKQVWQLNDCSSNCACFHACNLLAIRNRSNLRKVLGVNIEDFIALTKIEITEIFHISTTYNFSTMIAGALFKNWHGVLLLDLEHVLLLVGEGLLLVADPTTNSNGASGFAQWTSYRTRKIVLSLVVEVVRAFFQTFGIWFSRRTK